MMKILKEVFPECLVMLRKCKEGVTKEDQDLYLVGHVAGREKGYGRNSLTVRAGEKLVETLHLIQKFQTVSCSAEHT